MPCMNCYLGVFKPFAIIYARFSMELVYGMDLVISVFVILGA